MRVFATTSVDQARILAGRLIPFRAPHHTVSAAGIIGEVACAAGGVLYLDNAGEFRRHPISVLARTIREPGGNVPPLAIVIDVRNPFGPDGEEPNEDAQIKYAERVADVVDEILAAAGQDTIETI